MKNLIIIARTNVDCNSKPCKVNRPAKLPSVTPNPPGDIEIDPKIIDAEYIDANWKKSIRLTPIAKKTNEIPIASTIRKSIVRLVHPQMICGVDDFLIISWDCSILVVNFWRVYVHYTNGEEHGRQDSYRIGRIMCCDWYDGLCRWWCGINWNHEWDGHQNG